jgi:hypothetical protein
MPDLLEVTLTNGIPTSGSGTVKTINALMEDGGLDTIGNKTDPAVTNTDATAVTGISLWKQISKSIQLLVTRWPTALGAGGGLKIDGSGTVLPVSLNSVPAHDVFLLQKGHASSAQFTCGTTGYTPGKVVGTVLTFSSIASGAVVVNVKGVSLRIDNTIVISGETTYRLYLYSSSPPSAFTDNATFDLPSGDRGAFLGYIDIPQVVDLGATVFIQTSQDFIVATASSSLFGYLVANGTFTSTARVHTVSIKTLEI